jgi:hypothetical protein
VIDVEVADGLGEALNFEALHGEERGDELRPERLDEMDVFFERVQRGAEVTGQA